MQDPGTTDVGNGGAGGPSPPAMSMPPPVPLPRFVSPPPPPPPGAIWRRRGIPLWAIALLIVGALLWVIPFGILIPALGPAFTYGRALQAQVPAGSPPERIYAVMGARGYACTPSPNSGFSVSLFSNWHLFERVRWDQVIICRKTLAVLEGEGFTPDAVVFRMDRGHSIGFTAASRRQGHGTSSQTSVTMGQ